ncbi:glutamate synthase [Endomicrobiia bacterium]|uniref:glutamate synthase-related protein n=1 Tax=Endomicrobium trichonymphae TaxID=1408204 RepID=UPI000864F7C5|nr:glutamate synthase-related protein [Candidatus Endomicrobium trichonymphae]BAV58717.1 glutamate synthase large subunit GltB, FMN-binding domain [Candidatus Endomicrobium trichonymphae]GHT24873.1 glutamate synthase [Endomicrobiia bacterium]
MSLDFNSPAFEVIRDEKKCIQCQVCARQCSNKVHLYDEEDNVVRADDIKCVNCHRCVVLCPTKALVIKKYPLEFKENANWTDAALKEIYKQSQTGGVLLSSMGNPKSFPIYWDRMLLNASQVTNPSIDPLREPMETKVMIGRKPEKLEFDAKGKLVTNVPPQIELSIPIMFSAMSYGSISRNAHESLARAATELGICYNTGEGGLNRDFYKYGKNTIVQVASGRFGVHKEYLNAGAAIEIKIGQGAKPGIGGHLPGKKVGEDVSATRMIPVGSDAISPAPHHDIYSIEDLRQLIFSLKEVTAYKKPVFVKIAAVHNSAAIASGIVRAGADAIVIDGFRGGTGAAPTRVRDNVGIPIELALAAIDQRLREEEIRNEVSLIIAGSIRNSADVVKAVALGADAVYIGSAAVIALGCHLCRSCSTGKCNWGIATQEPELVKRLNPDIMYKRLVNLASAWNHEIQELLGGMGINAIDSLRGNRLMLRGIDLNEKELEILGIKYAGE